MKGLLKKIRLILINKLIEYNKYYMNLGISEHWDALTEMVRVRKRYNRVAFLVWIVEVLIWEGCKTYRIRDAWDCEKYYQ